MGVINAFPSGAPVQEYKNKIEITTSQEWTVPERVAEIRVTCIGGGAAGQGRNGGGGGYFAQKVLQVTPGTKYAITIGAGGVYSSSTVAGATSFGDLASANGGNGMNGGTGGGGSFEGQSSNYGAMPGGAGQEGYGASGGTAMLQMGRDGGSTLTAKGGKGLQREGYYGGSDSYHYYGSGGGGGAGINGGDGGDAAVNSFGASWNGSGGGGGGYGTLKLATDGDHKNSADYMQAGDGGKGGLGYGAGGGGAGVNANGGNGAPGICIIEY